MEVIDGSGTWFTVFSNCFLRAALYLCKICRALFHNNRFSMASSKLLFLTNLKPGAVYSEQDFSVSILYKVKQCETS